MSKPDFHLGIFQIVSEELRRQWSEAEIHSEEERTAGCAGVLISVAMANGTHVDYSWANSLPPGMKELVRPWMIFVDDPGKNAAYTNEEIEALFTAYKVAEALKNGQA